MEIQLFNCFFNQALQGRYSSGGHSYLNTSAGFIVAALYLCQPAVNKVIIIADSGIMWKGSMTSVTEPDKEHFMVREMISRVELLPNAFNNRKKPNEFLIVPDSFYRGYPAYQL